MMHGISCICITYRRSKLLEEAIESFLRQDYVGPKELIIVNDADDQVLHYDHPEVLIVNTGRRIRSIGEKRDLGIALAKYNYLAPWDDDDIYLPHRLSFSMEKMIAHNLSFYKLSDSYVYSVTDGIEKTSTNWNYSASMFTKEIHELCGGHGYTNSGQDAIFMKKVQDICNGSTTHNLIEDSISRGPSKLEDIYYVYRWGGIPVHLSAMRHFSDRDQLQQVSIERKKHDPATGDIYLSPRWDLDYVELARAFRAKGHTPIHAPSPRS